MAENVIFLGRVEHKILPCGIPLDPSSCPCQNINISSSSSSQEESFGKGDGEANSVGSCQSFNKLVTDDIQLFISHDRLSKIFCRTLKKLELSASLPSLLQHPELRRTLSEEHYRVVTGVFHRYIQNEPCNRSYSENSEAVDSSAESLKSSGSSTNLAKLEANIYQAIEILNRYTEIREIVKELRPEYSDQAQLFLRYMKYFVDHSLERLRTAPASSRAKRLHYMKLWKDNEKAKRDLKILTAALDAQRIQHDKEMELINAQCEKDSAAVKRVNRKCKEDIKHTIIRSERKMIMMCKASEMKQKEMQEDVSNAESHLKKIRAVNLSLEKDARDKRFKIESQLLGVINKYDTEIGEKQNQMEELIEQFEADKAKKEQLEAEIDMQAEMYDAFKKEQQEALDAMINEKLAKLMMVRAVKIMQRWWRGIWESRKTKFGSRKKTSKKNKKKK